MESDHDFSVNELKKALKEAGSPWEVKETRISSLSNEEKRLYLGATPPEHLDETSEHEVDHRSDFVLPRNYDLRNDNGKNFVTPPKDQNKCRSCVAFGAIGAVESTLKKQNNDPNYAIDISEAHLFFCIAHDLGKNCSTGWWPDAALNAFKSQGVVEEVCYPYMDGLAVKDCSGLKLTPGKAKYQVSSVVKLSSDAAIKDWIVNYGPATACFEVYSDFYYYGSGVYRHVSGEKDGIHCVPIVGYSDDEGCWICKNSWDEDRWGDKGFFKIAYGQCRIESLNGNYGAKGVTVSIIHAREQEHSVVK